MTYQTFIALANGSQIVIDEEPYAFEQRMYEVFSLGGRQGMTVKSILADEEFFLGRNSVVTFGLVTDQIKKLFKEEFGVDL